MTNIDSTEPGGEAPQAQAPTTELNPTTPKAITIIQGKAKVADLRPHPRNVTIYGEKDSVADLVKSINESKTGILEPLLITRPGEIIGGHRRYRAAQELKLEEVPVRVFDSTDELEIGKVLLEHNRQRIKSGVQIAAEANFLKELHQKQRERAKQKAEAAGEKLPPDTKRKTRDAVGEELGISGRTVDKVIKTNAAIETLRSEGKEEDAQEVESALNKSVERGLKVATAKGAIRAPKAKKKTIRKPTAAAAETPDTAQATVDEPSSDTKAERSDQNLSGASATPTPVAATPVVPAPAATPARPHIDSDKALTYADHVITFLRGNDAKHLSDPQRRDWGKALNQIATCHKTLGL